MNIGHQSNRRSVMWSETQQGILNRLAQQPLCWVQVQATRGSVPREEGAWMAVFADEVMGTIGGGHLEWQAIAQARQLLAQWDADPQPCASISSGMRLAPVWANAAAVRWSCTLHGLTPAMPNVCGP
jgi:hypothetical protein